LVFNNTVWWQNPFIWLGLIGGLIAFGVFYNRKIIKLNDQKLEIAAQKLNIKEMSNDKNRLKVQSIVNQLNPHFINNAMNWIQVKVEKDADSVAVLSKLSDNISTIFKNSRNNKSYHSLQDELKLVENYLFIQQKRFGAHLKYEIKLNATPKEIADTNIPLMMIQIHVENAIEHGIRNTSKGEGLVKISIENQNEYILIKIEDDGVGRAQAKIIGSKGTQQGTKMIEELIDIYNQNNTNKIIQTYTDLPYIDMSKKPYGTIVSIQLPKDYNYEI
jgi:sensor histidine kinase YesM